MGFGNNFLPGCEVNFETQKNLQTQRTMYLNKFPPEVNGAYNIGRKKSVASYCKLHFFVFVAE